jgi:hypothetical protein
MTYNSKTVSVDDLVLEGVLKVLDRSDSLWVGTMTELNAALVKVLGKRQVNVLPGSPSALRIVLNRVVNRLRTRKVSVKFARSNDHIRTRYVKFTR